MSSKRIKLTAIGDKVGGNSDLLSLPNKVENKDLSVDGKAVSVSLRDTGAMEELDRLQPAVYRDTDCFLLCYSQNVKESFNAIESKWCQEIKSLCPNKPFVLVAYKSEGTELVLQTEGHKLASKIGATSFLEYSSPSDLEALMSAAVKAVFSHVPAREAVHSGPDLVEEEGGGGGGGMFSCFKKCFCCKGSNAYSMG